MTITQTCQNLKDISQMNDFAINACVRTIRLYDQFPILRHVNTLIRIFYGISKNTNGFQRLRITFLEWFIKSIGKRVHQNKPSWFLPVSISSNTFTETKSVWRRTVEDNMNQYEEIDINYLDEFECFDSYSST